MSEPDVDDTLLRRQQHVNYIGADGKVHELWCSDRSGWRHNNLSDLANDPNILSYPGTTNSGNNKLDGYATSWNRQQHVSYEGNDLKVHELLYSESSGWQHKVLSDLANADDPNSLVSDGGELTGYVTPWDHQQHVIYLGRTDYKIHELRYSRGTGWRQNNLSDLAGQPGGSPDVVETSGYLTGWNQQQHVVYYDSTDLKVHELFYSDHWRHKVISDLAGVNQDSSLVTDGSLLLGYATPWNNQQHVNYVGNDGKVHELWYSDQHGWRHNNLSDLAGVSTNSPTGPEISLAAYATLWNEQQHVVYIGHPDSKVHELVYFERSGWRHNVISDLAGADDPNSLAQNNLIGYATPWNNQQHMIYVGLDWKIHELWHSDSGGWRHNVLSDLAGANDPNSLAMSLIAYPPRTVDAYVT